MILSNLPKKDYENILFTKEKIWNLQQNVDPYEESSSLKRSQVVPYVDVEFWQELTQRKKLDKI